VSQNGFSNQFDYGKFEDSISGKVANINHNLPTFRLDFYFQISQVFQIDINIKFERG